MKRTIHIRAKKPAGSHANAITLCGQRLHSTRVICKERSKVKIDTNNDANQGNWDWQTKKFTPGHMHVIFSITENQADMMDDVYEGKMQRDNLWVPTPEGPDRYLRVREMEWCDECFDGGKRTLKLFGKSDF
jgi:hypothetical protein